MTQHIGIDVSKAYLDIYSYPDGGVTRVRNERDAIERLAKRLVGVASVAMEATGGYERLALNQLRRANIPAIVVNARHIRNFARATGRLAKTDRLDAAVIAHYAATVGVRMRQTEVDYGLKDMVTRRRQLVEALVEEKNRLHQAQTSFLKKQITAHLAFVQKQLHAVDAAIVQHVKALPQLARRFAILLSVPGIGEVTAAVLLADLPELGTLSEREVAALVGVAPLNNDSGNQRGQRHIWGGRMSVRCALYMATVASVKCNPLIRAFYRRLREAGKPAKVALTAAMRKLVILLNALLKQDRTWVDSIT
jgi:transposase